MKSVKDLVWFGLKDFEYLLVYAESVYSISFKL